MTQKRFTKNQTLLIKSSRTIDEQNGAIKPDEPIIVAPDYFEKHQIMEKKRPLEYICGVCGAIFNKKVTRTKHWNRTHKEVKRI